ncbi:tetratricopeptide repeat protein, partial [Thiohalocapsa sp. ML1]|uniref:tetratricopeptide repeat protein n=1 Tax=Thiohalocapsa sp. ML1 TaxID=1431688 RepID=UPI0012E3D688
MDRPQPPLLGASRIRLVDGLLALVDEVQQTGTTRWVSLEAPSGWGKTRVAQALFERLAARQAQAYWPATILEATAAAQSDDIADRRKRVYPEWDKLNRASGSLPDFFWWGLSGADYKNGAASSILRKDIEQQIERHAVYLELARAALVKFHDRAFPSLADARAALSALVDEVTGYGVGEALALLMNSGSVPFSGLLVWLARRGDERIKAGAERKAALALSGPLPEAQPNLLDDTINNLGSLARPGLPVIVFIEDLHWAPPLIAELLERLVRTNAAILVISSTWPGELEHQPRLIALTQDPDLGQRCLRVRHDAPAPASLPAEAGLGELPAADMERLVLAYYPKAEPDTLRRLGARYNNPMMLELVCRQKAWRLDFPDGDLALEPEEIADLADDVAAYYKRIWDDLPPQVQQALVLATLAIPDDETAWDRDLVGRATAGCEAIADHAAIRDTLAQDRIPHGWVRGLTEWLRRFNEPDQLEIARQAFGSQFRKSKKAAFLTQLGACIKAAGFDDASAETQHRARLTLTLHRGGQGGIADADALVAIRALLGALEDQPLELPLRIRLGERARGLAVDHASTQALDVRAGFAYALGESGKIEPAIAASEDLLADQTRVLGPDHPDTLTTRNNIAYCRAQAGEIQPAIAAFEDLLADRTRVLGPDHPDTLSTRSNIAYWRAEAGEIEPALAAFEDLLADETRVLGPDHPDTLATRSDIAVCRAEAGEIQPAIAALEDLLADRTRVLGPDHPDTLRTRNNIASLRAEAGEIQPAIAASEALLVAQTRVLGPDHPHTLRTRNNIAFWRAQAGEIQPAIAAFEALLADSTRVLGPDHPDTLRTRYNIAYCRAQAGEIQPAIAALEALLADRTRVLGP